MRRRVSDLSSLISPFDTSQVPLACKIADIVPVHKKGKKDCREPRNFRQISLTLIVCNLDFLKRSQLKRNYYLDLTTGRHTETDQNQQTFFFEAFDSPHYERLLLKLKWYEIDGPLLF